MILRPIYRVQFDPANESHRASFRTFMRRQAWGDCDIRFAHDPAYGSVAEQVRTKMLYWYMAEEAAAAKEDVLQVPTPERMYLEKPYIVKVC